MSSKDLLDKLNRFHENMTSVEDCEQLLKDYAKTIDGFIIFGAMQTGARMKRILEVLGVPVLGFLDEYMKFEQYEGLKVFHSFDELRCAAFHRICFLHTTHFITNQKIMENKIYSYSEEAEILSRRVIYYCYHGKSLERNDGIILDDMGVINTNLCTLSCKGCSTLTPSVDKKDKINIPVERIKKDIDAISRMTDGIVVMQILGGEPLLHPDLPEIIYHIHNKNNIYSIMIDTNGTLIPNNDLIEAMKACDVMVHITDYGDASKEKNNLYKLLLENDILTFMRFAGDIPWNDYGEIYDRGDGQKQYENCRDKGCFSIYRGGLFYCGRDLRYIERNIYDPKKATFVDLDCKNTEEARKQMKAMVARNKPIYACRFCGGTDGKMDSGKQMEKKNFSSITR